MAAGGGGGGVLGCGSIGNGWENTFVVELSPSILDHFSGRLFVILTLNLWRKFYGVTIQMKPL